MSCACMGVTVVRLFGAAVCLAGIRASRADRSVIKWDAEPIASAPCLCSGSAASKRVAESEGLASPTRSQGGRAGLEATVDHVLFNARNGGGQERGAAN